MKLPVVFVFDIDSTIVGDVNPLLNRIQVHDFVRSSMKASKLAESTVQKQTIRNMKDIPDLLIRPHFAELTRKIKEYFPDSALFVYSAGVKTYVEDIVSYIEGKTGVQFMRPLFSRVECLVDETKNWAKSVKIHYPDMVKALVGKYPQLAKKENQDFVLNNRFVFIDDNDVIWDLEEKWIKAPAYKFMPVMDPSALLPIALRREKIVRDFLTNTIGSAHAFVEPEGLDDDERNIMYHTWMAAQHSQVIEKNKEAQKDKFFYVLQRALAKVKRSNRPFSVANLKNIKAALVKALV